MIKAANAADSTAKAYRTVSNSQEFRDAANKATQANEEMVTSTKKVVEAQKEQAKAQQTIITLAKETNTAWRSTIGTLDRNIKQTQQYKTDLQGIQKSIKDEIREHTNKNGVLVKVTDRLVALRKEESFLKQSISENNITIRQQTKEMQAAEGSMKQTSITLGLMKQAYRDLSDEQKRSDFGKVLKSQIDEIDASMKEADASIGNFFRNVGDYKNKFSEAFDQVLSGDTDAAIQTLDGSFKGLVASARAFIASPIGIAIAALAAIGLAAKAVWDYNEGLRENLTLTEQFTGATGASADAIRQQAQAMTDTFGGDFQENLNAAQKLVRAFGISYEEAFDQIAQGLANGGVANKEFFDTINEYPQLFAKAGYSAQEFINLTNTGFQQGLFSDKLVDGIKEADLALKEQTKTTRDALVNAFGSVWSDELLRRIKTGETTTKDALIEIANQAQETGLNQQQLYQLTADVFKGAGEDAGGAAKFFDILNESVGNLGEPLTETSKNFLALRDANVELQQAMDSALKSDSVLSFMATWDIAWVKIQTGFFEIIAAVREAAEWFNEMTDRSETVSRMWNTLSGMADKLTAVVDFLSVTFTRMSEQFGLTKEESDGFLKSVMSLFDPLKTLEAVLNILVTAIEFSAAGFVNMVTGAEAFHRTMQQLVKLDFDNLKSIGENADDIRAENAAVQERIRLEKEKTDSMKIAQEIMQQMVDATKAGLESIKETEREQAKEAEANAKKQAELQKKYAAEEKRRRDQAAKDAEKAAKDRFDEEVRLMDATLKHYQLTSGKRLNLDESFSASMITAQKNYLDEVYKMELEKAEKVSGLDIENVRRKFENGEKLTSNELSLINYEIELAQKLGDEKKKIDTDVDKFLTDNSVKGFENRRFLLEMDYLMTEKTAENKEQLQKDYQDAINELRLEELETIYKVNLAEIEAKIANNEILTEQQKEYYKILQEIRAEDRATEAEAEEAEKEKRIEDRETFLTFLGESLGKEREFVELNNAIIAFSDAKTAEEKLAAVAGALSASAKILGEYTVFGKAAAVSAAVINTYLAATAAISAMSAIPVVGPALGIAAAALVVAAGVANVAKIISAKPPEPPKFSATFATGVYDSSFQGRALVDEEGPELHYDKYGRLKSSGKGRPNIRDVKKGDTIFPADISKKIKEISSYNPVPDLLMNMDFRNSDSNDYRFEKLEGKVDEVRKAINGKPNYVWDGSNLIEVSGGGGSSHQRIIPKMGKDKPRQNTIE